MSSRFFLIICVMLCCSKVHSQIGYQVSLLNTATGEPRANVTVNATINITNSEDELVYSCTQSSTSNDFGVLTFTIGNEDTFKDVDWNKLPFFIEVQVDGNTIGKSQILTVPVAEYAKKTGILTRDILEGIWVSELYTDEYDNVADTIFHRHNKHILSFSSNDVVSYTYLFEYGNVWEYGNTSSYSTHCIWQYTGTYYIDGNDVIIITDGDLKDYVYNSDGQLIDGSTEKINEKACVHFFNYIPNKGIIPYSSDEGTVLIKQ